MKAEIEINDYEVGNKIKEAVKDSLKSGGLLRWVREITRDSIKDLELEVKTLKERLDKLENDQIQSKGSGLWK